MVTSVLASGDLVLEASLDGMTKAGKVLSRWHHYFTEAGRKILPETPYCQYNAGHEHLFTLQ